jgi:phosphotransferase system  glucose/maltose/N-acetylglucosamine-specific IIC component
MDFFSDCTPAKLYAILAIFSTAGSIYAGMPLFQMLWSILGSAMWLLLLNWLCGKGFTWLSWVLVVFPFIILFGAFIAMIIMLSKTEPQQKTNAQTEEKK